MCARVVETAGEPGKARGLCHAIDDKLLPILRKQHGFVDAVVMVLDTGPNRVIAISFWKTKEGTQLYEREQYDGAH